MARVQWDAQGERLYEIGLDRGVLYLDGQEGVPWNGLVSVSEKASGGAQTAYYVDGQKFLNVSAPEEFGASLEAYTYPDEFMACDGTLPVDNGLFIKNQPRKSFGLSYRTGIGNDVKGDSFGYRLHIIYGVLAAPSQQQNNTGSDSPAPSTFSWDLTALPPLVSGFKPAAHIVIDTRIAHPGAVSDAENLLYGTLSAPSRLPTIAELVEIFEENATLRITDNGDGTWTATALDSTDIISVNVEGFTGTIIDNFDDNSFNAAIWLNNHGTETGGKYHLLANNTYPELHAIDTLNMATGFAAVQVSSSGTAGSDSDFYLGFTDDAGNAIFVVYNFSSQSWDTSTWAATVAGDFVEETTATIAAGDWVGVGLIGDDGVCHVYHSTDGVGWTQIHTFPISGSLDKASAHYMVSSGDSVGSGSETFTLIVDNATYVIPDPAGTEFTITWDSAILTGDTTYTVTSL